MVVRKIRKKSELVHLLVTRCDFIFPERICIKVKAQTARYWLKFQNI